MRSWLGPQKWERAPDGPCISLGAPGAFDDAHVFAPCVASEENSFSMWYCGSRGTVANRVFGMGLATSVDGTHFAKQAQAPLLCFADRRRSILTPTLLRHPDGSVYREDGKLRIWFSACKRPADGGKIITLHEATSLDGWKWMPPSKAQLEHVYAPTIIKEDGLYRMWYTDVSKGDPWCIRYAESDNGCQWEVASDAVLGVDQDWERKRLFYPTVCKADGFYLMWYGSYSHSKGEAMKTSLGFAVSEDGRNWQKNPYNPVFKPEPSNDWETHFTTSQSVLRLQDGSWRMWYASRPKPPFVHKYFAIGTARWRSGDGR